MDHNRWSLRAPSLSAMALTAALLIAPAIVRADAASCKSTLSKAAASFEQAKLKALAKCEAGKRKGKLAASTDCHAEDKTVGAIAKAQQKLTDAIDAACVGQTPVSIGWDGGTVDANNPVFAKECSAGDRPGEPCSRETECPGQCIGGAKNTESCSFNSSCGNRRCVHAKCIGGSMNGLDCSSLALKDACEAGADPNDPNDDGVCNYLEQCDGGASGALGICVGGTNAGATCKAPSECTSTVCDSGCNTGDMLDCVAGYCEQALCNPANGNKDCGLCVAGPNLNQSCNTNSDCGLVCAHSTRNGQPCVAANIAIDCPQDPNDGTTRTCAAVASSCSTGTCLSTGFCTAGSGAHERASTGLCSPVDRCPSFENNNGLSTFTCDGGTHNGESCTVDADCPSGACKSGCGFDITSSTDVNNCLACIGEASVDQINTTVAGNLQPRVAACVGGDNDLKACNLASGETDCPNGGVCTAADTALEKCKAKVASAASKLFAAQRKALQKCEAAVLAGGTGPCPTSDTRTKMSKASAKFTAAVAKACGGADGVFGGGDDVGPNDISKLTNCPNFTIPGASSSCAGSTGRGPIKTLEDLADCLACVTEFKVDCTDSISVPANGALAAECNPLCGNHKIDGHCSNDSSKLCGSSIDCTSPGVCQPVENCDDGNAITGDTCPGNCSITTCSATATQHVVNVIVSAPPATQLGAISVLLEYPDGTVSVPGTGESRVAPQFDAFSGINDVNYALTIASVANSPDVVPVSPSIAYKVTFDTCSGAVAPTASQFRCVVTSAANTNSVNVAGVSCSVTVL